ncbi:uncharacterized protein BXZ73DRAFT_87885 [Epithele typhae]|uniref:uncharacterized protein n=1 Tax=Epithele typhae TaxID=378194 RepID=UPI00200822CF|nr:uncharacterized protein BXZ73DRAFT_87885 [Epithele typhae]KAH9942234.1 hypothetical protein BXZ73DRAFT_87885 [Epithele typhae]
MSAPRPLRDRIQSTSPEPDGARPTTPLRISKSPRLGLSPRQPSTRSQLPVARRSSNSFKHVREGNLVTKSPFRSLLSGPAASPAASSSTPTRKVSGEKRPRPNSMNAQAESDKPLGFKRRQSKAFQGLIQKELVTNSTFRRPNDRPSSSSDDPPAVPPKLTPRRATLSNIPVPSPIRSALSNPRKMHGPRTAGERAQQKLSKTVTFDENCDVLEFSDNEDVEDLFFDEDDSGYGYGYSYEHDPDQDQAMEAADGSFRLNEDSITGMVNSMLQAAGAQTPPHQEDEEDTELLPPSPSPAKIAAPLPQRPQAPIQDEEPPFEESFRSVRSADSLDPANLSIGHSEVSLTTLETSLLADTRFDGDVLTGASFAPLANSSPRPRSRSRSGTPADHSFDRSIDRSFEARSTPAINPSRLNSPRSGSGSPFQRQLFKPPSTSSLGSLINRRASPHVSITREVIQERLLRRKSEEVLVASQSASPISSAPSSVSPEDDVDVDMSHDTEPDDAADAADAKYSNPLTHANTYDGVLSLDPEPQPTDPPRPSLPERASTMRTLDMDTKRALEGLDLDFEHGFGLGEEGMSVSAGLTSRAKPSNMRLGEVSALDKLMEDMAQNAGANGMSAAELSAQADLSMLSNTDTDGPSQLNVMLRVEAVTEGVKAATFALPTIEHDEGMGFDVDMEASMSGIVVPAFAPSSSSSPAPPPLPAKDAIRAREELIRAKRREMREVEEDGFDRSPATRNLTALARPARRRSRSTGDADDLLAPRAPSTHHRGAASQDDGLLDFSPSTINRELKKREVPKRSSKYHVREHTETIYASADTGRSSTPGLSDDTTEKAWRSIRRPSDMNEFASQIRAIREAQQTGKAHGKVFVRVMGLRGLKVPVPKEPTKITCVLNNGIHFVATPDSPFDRECTIDQEFELIEHSKLEFTLTIKVKKEAHIAAQIKALQPPAALARARPPPQPVPPSPSKGHTHTKSGGMRSFLGLGSHKKNKTLEREASPAPPPAPAPAPPRPNFKPPENLARYLKPDGSLARTLVEFNQIAAHCDTRLLEIAYPLVGCKYDTPGLQAPPLPGIPAAQLPQSLEECTRGLTHTRWHKSCYMQGTLTQIGGDCTTWRRRHLRIIGCSLVAYNDITRRAIASIDLRKATKVEDESAPVRSPASGPAYDDDDLYGVGSVERAFRLEFGSDVIKFYADTDQEKEDW